MEEEAVRHFREKRRRDHLKILKEDDKNKSALARLPRLSVTFAEVFSLPAPRKRTFTRTNEENAKIQITHNLISIAPGGG